MLNCRFKILLSIFATLASSINLYCNDYSRMIMGHTYDLTGFGFGLRLALLFIITMPCSTHSDKTNHIYKLR